jgi:hypothetical protein
MTRLSHVGDSRSARSWQIQVGEPGRRAPIGALKPTGMRPTYLAIRPDWVREGVVAVHAVRPLLRGAEAGGRRSAPSSDER